jgi:hypothetical protein
VPVRAPSPPPQPAAPRSRVTPVPQPTAPHPRVVPLPQPPPVSSSANKNPVVLRSECFLT